MLDIKMIRTDGEKVKERIRKREMNLDSIVDEILDIDKKRRELTGEVESKKAEQNADSKKIPQLKKAGEDTAPLMERMKALSAEIKEGADRVTHTRSLGKAEGSAAFPAQPAGRGRLCRRQGAEPAYPLF